MPRRKPTAAPVATGARAFPLYLALETGGGSKRALVQALERDGTYIGPCAREMIARASFAGAESPRPIRLARVLTVLMPDEPEAHGMLALMLLHDARRASRVDADGELVTLENQDRSQWDQAEIAEGTELLERALRRRRRARVRSRRGHRTGGRARRR